MGSRVESSSGAWVHLQADYWSYAVHLYLGMSVGMRCTSHRGTSPATSLPIIISSPSAILL